jgi:hypothetical protein
MKIERKRWMVSYNARNKKWYAQLKGEANIEYPTQGAAIKETVVKCRDGWANGVPHELIIKAKNGKIRDNRTYGNDPRGGG